MNTRNLLPCVILLVTPCIAQDSSVWVPLLQVPEARIDVRTYQAVTPEGLSVRFLNASNTEIYFDFYVPGLQVIEDSVGQGRIHLGPGRKSPVIQIPNGAAMGGLPVLLRVRVGIDTGKYWNE